MTTNTLRPRDAKTLDQICSLRTDNKSVSEGWILLEGDTVVVTNQETGKRPTGKVEFTRSQFASLIDWYNRPQKLKLPK